MTKENIIFNRNHYVSGSKGTFTYKLPTSVKFENAEVGVQSIAVYNSTFNIESSRGNNTITVRWVADTTVDYTFTIPDGYYSYSDLNYFLQQQMILEDLYVTNSSGDYVYFVEILTNATRYAAQLNSYALPDSSTASTLSYTKPAGGSWDWPTTSSTPQIIINAAFGSLIGFEAGTFPSSVSATNVQQLSSITPTISPVSSYILGCNLVNATMSIPSSTFFSLPLTASYGALITLQSQSVNYVTVMPGLFNEITLQLYDQSFEFLNLQDTDIVIVLSIVITK